MFEVQSFKKGINTRQEDTQRHKYIGQIYIAQ